MAEQTTTSFYLFSFSHYILNDVDTSKLLRWPAMSVQCWRLFWRPALSPVSTSFPHDRQNSYPKRWTCTLNLHSWLHENISSAGNFSPQRMITCDVNRTFLVKSAKQFKLLLSSTRTDFKDKVIFYYIMHFYKSIFYYYLYYNKKSLIFMCPCIASIILILITTNKMRLFWFIYF